jgi:hypothetical protein
MNPAANDKHRIDASKALDSFTGEKTTPAEDRFSIVINLGNDKILIDKPIAKDVTPAKPALGKSIRPTPRDVDAEIVDHDNDDAQRSFCFPAIAAIRNGNEGGGAAR